VSGVDWEPLVAAAIEARARAYAPYSGYRVGAALLTVDGHVFVGCNVENASYPVCLCAERSALATAVSAGHQRFAAIVVATAGDRPAPPCGMCRQALVEFEPSLPVLGVTPEGVRELWSLSELLPGAFRSSALVDGQEE
jgi:cytidine deaminase